MPTASTASRGLWISGGVIASALVSLMLWAARDRLTVESELAQIRERMAGIQRDVERIERDLSQIRRRLERIAPADR